MAAKQHYLTSEERQKLATHLNQTQRDFLAEQRRYRLQSQFLNASLEAGADWEFVDYHEDPQMTGQLKCECGRTLKYQYVVVEKKTGVVHKFGITHFAQHMAVPEKVAHQVASGIQRIDVGLDEILVNTFQEHLVPSQSLVDFITAHPETSRYAEEFMNFAKVGLAPYTVVLKSCEQAYRTYQIEEALAWREKMALKRKQEEAAKFEKKHAEKKQSHREWLQHYAREDLPRAATGFAFLDGFNGLATKLVQRRIVGKDVLGFIGNFIKESGAGTIFQVAEMVDAVVDITNELPQNREDAFDRILKQVRACLPFFTGIGLLEERSTGELVVTALVN